MSLEIRKCCWNNVNSAQLNSLMPRRRGGLSLLLSVSIAFVSYGTTLLCLRKCSQKQTRTAGTDPALDQHLPARGCHNLVFSHPTHKVLTQGQGQRDEDNWEPTHTTAVPREHGPRVSQVHVTWHWAVLRRARAVQPPSLQTGSKHKPRRGDQPAMGAHTFSD